MTLEFDAHVTAIVFDRGAPVFALGDGTIAWPGGERVAAHDGAILSAAAHPTGEGVITGGDDGRLAWSRPGGAETLASRPNSWIDAVTTSAVSGLIAFSCGRDVGVLDSKDPGFERRFSHASSVADLAFDPKGRRLAAATYGGAALWYARIEQQSPVMLRWAGSHIALAFSPDGRFLISSMQESALHGWRISDAMDMRMGGYPAKVRSLAFVDKGAALATSGARGVVVWPFSGAGGPMGRQALELGADERAVVTRVAGEAAGTRVCAGLNDGRVWVGDLQTSAITSVSAGGGSPISALAMFGGVVAWGDEAGGAGVAEL